MGVPMSNAALTVAFVARAIDAMVCDELRLRDDAGHQPEVLVDEEGGNPLRCCLTLSQPGDQVMLASYAPLRRWAAGTGAKPGPYLEIGPVFLHPTRCDGPGHKGYPDAFRGWPRVLRAYDANGRIIGGALLDEDAAPEPLIDRLFTDDSVAFIHVRAVIAGCFTFWIDRCSD